MQTPRLDSVIVDVTCHSCKVTLPKDAVQIFRLLLRERLSLSLVSIQPLEEYTFHVPSGRSAKYPVESF